LATVSIRLAESDPVFICENPRVIEAALAAGIKLPLVCTAGNPTTVTLQLLEQLAASGCKLAYRGDFDWPGLAIANRLIARFGCGTWLFDTVVYERAVETTGVRELVPLTGQPIVASWDDKLGPLMTKAAVAVHEEVVLDAVVEWLSTLSGQSTDTGLG
jgi:uncharacterized protein (TIGR02679 family)